MKRNKKQEKRTQTVQIESQSTTKASSPKLGRSQDEHVKRLKFVCNTKQNIGQKIFNSYKLNYYIYQHTL